jgi:RNA polymerase sigma-70 factor, ECF subfamily
LHKCAIRDRTLFEFKQGSTSMQVREQENVGREERPRERDYLDLVEPHRGELRAHIRRMLGSSHDAEDALQETLIRAWRSLRELERPGAVRGWLYRIATNASLDQIRRRRSGRVVPVEDPPSPDPHDELDPHDRFERFETVERALITADRMLTPRQRKVLILREVLGMSAEQAARRLETSVPAVNSALQRARATIDQRADARAA